MAAAATSPVPYAARWGTHALLVFGVLVFALPIWITLVGSTHDASTIGRGEVPLWFGSHFIENYADAWSEGGTAEARRGFRAPVSAMLLTSFVMAMGIALGKIAVSLISAYAVVYFSFPGRMLFFWMIFITLMLPVEVRIMPTFKVAVDLGIVNTTTGLILPLVASATATLLFRQFFLTIPDELVEAAKIDGAGPLKFFRDVVLPLSGTSIAALFVILFIYGWNQYLWPLLIISDRSLETVIVGITKMIGSGDAQSPWHTIMATTVMALLPPVLVVLLMQRWFVKGLVDTEK
jgi:sn-glycerol 3-phosphate transport system permease protein